MKTSFTICLVFAILMGASAVFLTGSGGEARAEDATYIGTKMCGMCHKGEKKGSQLEIWQASAHANAYATLGTDAAKEAAAKAGIEGNPQESDQCLVCHVTAFGVDAAALGTKFVKEEGVQCEACHGPGSMYKSKKVMEDREAAIKAGLLIPDETTCKTCHNEKSPTFKGFDYKTYYEKIAHPTPEEAG
jgi:hypothetical protein